MNNQTTSSSRFITNWKNIKNLKDIFMKKGDYRNSEKVHSPLLYKKCTRYTKMY